MRWLVLILLMLAIGPLWSKTVYYWVDENGLDSYSDQWVPGAQRLGTANRGEATEGRDEAPESAGPFSGPYETFEIAQPEPEAVIIDSQEGVGVSLLVIPSLATDDRIQVVLNGASVGDGQRDTQFSLRGLSVGTHEFSAQILDPDGAVIARTGTQSVHIRPSSSPSEPNRP